MIPVGRSSEEPSALVDPLKTAKQFVIGVEGNLVFTSLFDTNPVVRVALLFWLLDMS